MKNLQKLKGMRDLYSLDSKKYTLFLDKASTIVDNYGYSFLKTPLLEETSLFKRTSGDSSDVVSKEMYDFTDKGNNDVSLRPEGTASAVRCFVENKLDRVGTPTKWYYAGSMYRYETPQKGRFREFNQFGCESFGIKSPYEDASLIFMIKEILDSFNIKYELRINNLGCKECMPNYREKLFNFVEEIDLCDDCVARKKKNVLRILDCKNESCQNNISQKPRLIDNICDSCSSYFEELLSIFNFNNLNYILDDSLVRGLDYYNELAFEFIVDGLAIAGGGRYDSLVSELGGRETPAVGFAIGIDRLIEYIELPEEDEDIFYFGSLDKECINYSLNFANIKRKTNKCFVDYRERGFSKQFNVAEKLGANIVVLVGKNEIESDTLFIKDLRTQEIKNISIKDFLK